MRKFKFLSFILLAVTMLSVTSCGDDEPNSFDSSKLEGIWNQVFDSRIQDASVVKYVFNPETSNSGSIELYESNWPDEGWTVTDLYYRVSEKGHLNIFRVQTAYDDKSQIYIECDIHKLTKSEMVWYKTGSNEEIARFNKDTKIDNN